MIRVYQDGNPEDIEFVEMQNARIAEAAPGLEKRIKEEFRTKFPSEGNQEVALMICDWLVERLPEYQTLYDEDPKPEGERNGCCCGQARHDHLPNRRRHSGGSGSAGRG